MRTLTSSICWSLLGPLLLLWAACDETPARRPSPGELLSRYAKTGSADSSFCLLVDLVCAAAEFSQTAECAQLAQICAQPHDGVDGGPADAGAAADGVPAPPTPTPGSLELRRTTASLVVDGEVETAWSGVVVHPIGKLILGQAAAAADCAATFGALWTTDALHLLYEVTDDAEQQDSSYPWDDDAVELYLDLGHEGGAAYDANDFHFVFKRGSATAGEYAHGATSGVTVATRETAGGYRLEARVPWSTLGFTPTAGTTIGLDAMVDDDDDGGVRDTQLSWNSKDAEAYRWPDRFGVARLLDPGGAPPADAGPPPKPDASPPPKPDASPPPLAKGSWYTTMAPGAAVVYPATASSAVPFSGDFSVVVDGKSSPVYAAKIGTQHNYQPPPAQIKNEPVGFTNFDITGAVTAVVTVKNRAVTSAKVVPTAYGVNPTVSGNTVTVPIPHYGKYELQINGSESRPLYLFANPVETGVPKPGDSGVVYYGPGVHTIGHKAIGSNTTVYLAPGAIVHGGLDISGSNVTVRGRGILDGSGFKTHDGNMLKVYGSDHTLEGIQITDSPGWTVTLWHVSRAKVDNLKVFAYRQNSDGIDLSSCKDVEVRNVFLRNWDDGVVIKAFQGDVDDIRVLDSVIANDLGAGALEIGKEERASSVGNILFQNIDIIHSYAYSAIDIGTGDEATIHDVTYKDIRVENHHGSPGWYEKWINLELQPDIWSGGAGPGQMSNITFINVHFLSGTHWSSTIKGYDSGHMIKNVTFDNLRVFGQKVTAASQMKLGVSNASGVVFK